MIFAVARACLFGVVLFSVWFGAGSPDAVAATTAEVPLLTAEGLGKGTVALEGPWQFHLGDNPARSVEQPDAAKAERRASHQSGQRLRAGRRHTVLTLTRLAKGEAPSSSQGSCTSPCLIFGECSSRKLERNETVTKFHTDVRGPLGINEAQQFKNNKEKA
jgi:hypothetical protein